MVFINASSVIGGMIAVITTEVTGSIFLTMLLISMIMIAACIGFGMPIELSIPLVFPFFLAGVFLTGQFMPVFGAAILFMSVIIAKRFFMF